MLDDTIVAISTPVGAGGIGIVRISGKDALSITDKVFRPKDKGKPSAYKTHTVHYGHVIDIGETIDEALLTVMRAPRTYTKEDIVEINCHSGIVALRKTLKLILRCGARLAEPGEFTKRAFLNGRIDLAQAEAVCDIIQAKSEFALDAALAQLGGRLSNKINEIKDGMIELLAGMEALLDFPDEGIDEGSIADMDEALRVIVEGLAALLANSAYGMVLRDGVKAVIVGRPNVGKSSLFNAVLRQNRAIVTPIAGTTRDVIEEFANIRGIPFKISDTCGIKKTQDPIEAIGVEKARAEADKSDITILALDGSSPVQEEDVHLLKIYGSAKTILCINKSDLPQQLDDNFLREGLSVDKVIRISALTGAGIEDLEAALFDSVFNKNTPKSDEALIANARQRNAVERAHQAVGKASSSLENGESLEFVSSHVRDGLDAVGEITGVRAGAHLHEDVLNRIFEKFCIGK